MERRRLLQAIGSGSVGIGTVGAISGSSTAKENNIAARDHSEDATASLIKQAQSDSDLRALIDHANENGWRIPWDSATTKRITSQTETGYYDYIVVEAESSSQQVEKEEELVFIWIGNDTMGLDLSHHTVIHHVQKTDKPTASGLFGWDKVKVIKSEAGDIIQTERDFHRENELGADDYTFPPGGGSSECVEVDVQIAPDAKWDCVALAVAGAIPTSVPCSTCILDVTRTSCAVCAIATVIYKVSSMHCFSDLGPVVQADVEEWFFEEHDDFSYSDFATWTDEALVVDETFYNEDLPVC
ncbi:hypothetical protein [Natrialba hulunbeirensis]|uniref:hypothetical protein n=1 Tax=Natrialba hulunbeirensis TaxID=123783 RepID=UPI000A036DBF|nr:hypothetical protein [Natrialba hulunbeirensis]